MNTIRTTMTLALGLLLGMGPAAFASDIGIPVTVVVTQEDGTPIPTAVVRHPLEAARHPVNTVNGEWTESVLYMQDGSEYIFEKGMTLEFEGSAPGYINQKIQYLVRKRKNRFPVVLHPMVMEDDAEEMDDPVIQFGRDKPID